MSIFSKLFAKRRSDQIAEEPAKGFAPMIPGGVVNTPIYKDWDDQKAIRDGLKASTYVYKSIDFKAKGFSQVQANVYSYDETGERVRLDEHPLYKLWDRPNPFMSGGEFRERLIQFLDLSGNAPILKVRGVGGEVVALYPIPPAFVTPIADDRNYISGYLYTHGADRYQIPTEDVIHLQHPDPSNALWGLSPLKVVARTVDTDVDATAWNKVAMQNRGVPDGVMTADIKLTDAQYDQAIEKWEQQKANGARAHKTLFLSGGWSYVQMANTAVEMDFINSRKMTREEITAAFGVPLILLGIMDNATYSNYEQARLSFWEDTEVPLIDRLMNNLTFGLASEFGETLELEADYSNIPALKARLASQADTMRKFIEMGYTRNEANNLLGVGFQNDASGDRRYLISSLIPEELAGDPYGDDPSAPDGGSSRNINETSDLLDEIIAEAGATKAAAGEHLKK